MKRMSLVNQVSAILVVGLATVCSQAADNPSVSKLLDHYSRALDSHQSFIDHFSSSCDEFVRLPDGRGTPPGAKHYARGENRYDGSRYYVVSYEWGYFSPDVGELPESKPYYYCRVLTPDRTYTSTGRSGKDAGVDVSMPPPRKDIHIAPSGLSGMTGYMNTDKRLDKVLRGADTISVRGNTERVGTSECYVIEARTKNGQYTVWLDPDHGYNASQIVCHAGRGNYVGDRPMPENATLDISLRDVRFEQIDNVWVPVEAEGSSDFVGPWESRTKARYTRSNIMLNPDHDKLGSFAHPIYENPNNDPELRNGTPVGIAVGQGKVKYTWQDGKLIPDVDKVAIDLMNKMTSGILEERNAGKSRSANPEDAAAVGRILEEYRRTQDRISSLYCEGTVTKGKTLLVESRYAADSNRVNVLIKRGDAIKDGLAWDGKKTFRYSDTARVSVSIADRKRPYDLLAMVYPGAPLLGYFHGQSERIDALLSKAGEATVSQDKLNDIDCPVIKCSIGRTTYRVWFSPVHGYHIVRADIHSDSWIYRMSQVQFKQVDDVWVPLGCSVIEDAMPQYTYNRTKIELKPDFKAMKAFDLPIPDGAEVSVEGKTGPYYWKGGLVVDQEGRNGF